MAVLKEKELIELANKKKMRTNSHHCTILGKCNSYNNRAGGYGNWNHPNIEKYEQFKCTFYLKNHNTIMLRW